MKASVVDLRYNMRDVLKALERNEEVQVIYHGKIKGVIKPYAKGTVKKVKDHPLFGMYREDKKTVVAIMKELRKGRYDDL